MIKLAPLAAAAALLALGACKQETIVARTGDDMQNELANAPKVELPPAVKSSKAYRCKDNSLVYIDLFQGDKMANIRSEKTGTPTQLKADDAGEPLIAPGYSVSGTGDTLTVERPGKGSQACKA